MDTNQLRCTNLIGIGETGLSFANFVLSIGCRPNTSTLLLNKKKSKEISTNAFDVVYEENSTEVDYTEIADEQDNGKPSLIIFGGAGKFSGDAAIKLNAVLKLIDQPTSFIVIGPFKFEGEKAQKRASDVLAKLKKLGAISHYFSNQDIFSLISPTASFEDGFAKLNSKIFNFYITHQN